MQVANMIKNKTTEEIRATFNIKNDFTKAEEEQVRKEASPTFKEETHSVQQREAI